MDEELSKRVQEMFNEHFKDGLWTGIGYSLIAFWWVLFIIQLILSSKK